MTTLEPDQSVWVSSGQFRQTLRRRTSTHTGRRTAMRHCTATYDTVCRHGTLQMLNYMLLSVVVNGHNCVAVRRRTDATYATQHAAQIEPSSIVWHVASVDVRRRSVCERCRRNQRAWLQRRRTSTYVATYGAVRTVNGVYETTEQVSARISDSGCPEMVTDNFFGRNSVPPRSGPL